ncbi:hypothetical protein KKH23_01960 [Patescibacteria group bacterium]|nr:hypothetical protein [Patescibacteria group bacterium]MBU0777001.1 hypothetical protein [Patescibacteria group bacterium]MBU0845946.1 hypothetical protein [Patescibacteria group bacterium]MBU0923031.1 hypothetical protein [Patescibacteria group bacterium]MBU1066206.1 hypothetical protein [Patescibacteria group bacterium]
MTEDSEAEKFSPQSLSIKYRGQIHQVPLVRRKAELEKRLQKEVIPAFNKIKALNPNADLAVTEYVYSKDESLEGMEKSAEKMLEDLEMDSDEAGNLARISRRKGFNPVLSDRINWRKEEPDTEVDDKFLPFTVRTYVIGPMVVSEDIFKKENGPTLEEDVKASTFFIGNAVAVDGEILLQGLDKKQLKRVTNKTLIELVEPLLKENS